MTYRKYALNTSKVDTYANRPASGTIVGQRFRASDGGPVFVWDGTEWRPEYEMVLGYEPPSAGWTALDAGLGANVAFTNGVYELSSTTASASLAWSMAVRSFSGNGDFDLKARIRKTTSLRNSSGGTGTMTSGILLRDSVSGNIGTLLLQEHANKDAQIQVSLFSSATSGVSDPMIQFVQHMFLGDAMWLRIADVSSVRSYYVSTDGIRWVPFYSHSAGSRYPTSPNQAGLVHQTFLSSSTAAYDSGVRLESWKVA